MEALSLEAITYTLVHGVILGKPLYQRLSSLHLSTEVYPDKWKIKLAYSRLLLEWGLGVLSGQFIWFYRTVCGMRSCCFGHDFLGAGLAWLKECIETSAVWLLRRLLQLTEKDFPWFISSFIKCGMAGMLRPTFFGLYREVVVLAGLKCFIV